MPNKGFIFSAKSKNQRTDSWYLVKEIFGDPQNFGGLDPADMLLEYMFNSLLNCDIHLAVEFVYGNP